MTQWTWIWENSLEDRETWRATVHGVAKSEHSLATEQQKQRNYVLQQPPEKQDIWESIYLSVFIYLFWGLVITEANKIHSLPSASWRPRKASDVIQYESEGLRTRRAD